MIGIIAAAVLLAHPPSRPRPAEDQLQAKFISPPDTARPWVYWYFMDGNLTRSGITGDLEAMQRAGIGGAIFFEVGIGVPKGPINFMSPEWQALLHHAFAEAKRLHIALSISSGPGWCGTGGPWVQPEDAMQHLVASDTLTEGPARFNSVLARPKPRPPYFGDGSMTPTVRQQWKDFYRDVAVLAFPTPNSKDRIKDIDEKALYHRDPFSSSPGVKPFLTAPKTSSEAKTDSSIPSPNIIDLTSKLDSEGRLDWDVPPGKWTIMRFGRTLTGQTTRPAPDAGLGLETDKFSAAALDRHFDSFLGTLLKQVAKPTAEGGLADVHFDSWEMGSQNWSPRFREEFRKRRGYDPLKMLPTMSGYIVDSDSKSERFLWDLRQTAQELVITNHIARLKALSRKNGLTISVEPYDLNPTSDLELAKDADIPMGEFWSTGYSFPTEYSIVEATSIAHTNGHPVVGSESFTATAGEDWRQYPGSMKAQTDWAFCAGINRLYIHRFEAQPAEDKFPGMTMGPYGVHWDRTQTWWDMAAPYHEYIARCQAMLRGGHFVADVLYLAPEGAPNVFLPPRTALDGDPGDRRGYNFDGCGPSTLIAKATVRNGRIAFRDGMSYRLLVLPRFDSMTPQLLQKIAALVSAGATVVGRPPIQSPSLVDYPNCDRAVQELAAKLWGDKRQVGKGEVILDSAPVDAESKQSAADIYPTYGFTASILANLKVQPDFESDGDIRYIHRQAGKTDLYFLGSRKDAQQNLTARFRISGRQPEWWNPITGETRMLSDFAVRDGITSIPLHFGPLESGFVVFRKPGASSSTPPNFEETITLQTLNQTWQVSFDPKWGGPAMSTFPTLSDWSQSVDPGIKYYSGKAVYRTTFDSTSAATPRFLSLGKVRNLASVKLNGKELGIIWCDPWRVEIPKGLLKATQNHLEITVANLWINRLIGDSALPEPQRRTSTTYQPYNPDSPLQESGLLGPVTLQK